MRRRTLLAGALAAAPVAAGAATGCTAGGAASAQGAGGRVTISYGMWDPLQVAGMEKIIKAFEAEHPKISVKIQVTPFTSYWTTLKTAMRGGSAPDVFWMNAVNLRLYASEGVLEPLDPYIERDGFDMGVHPPELLRMYTHGGTRYAMPKDFDTIGLWYNKELFDKAGINYPDESWTWDTVRDAAAELTDPRSGVHGIAAEMSRQYTYYNTIAQAGGYVLRDGRSGFADPRTIDGLRFWTDLIDRGRSPSQSAMTDTRGRQLYLSERVAMNYDLSAMASQMYAEPAIKDHGGVAVLPKGRERATTIHGLAAAISGKSPNTEAAWQFVKFLGSRKAAEIQAREGVTISSYEGTQKTWIESMPEFDLKVFTDMLDYAVPYPASKHTAVWENLQPQLLGGPFTGKGGIEEAARTLARQMDLALEQEK
ncbi:ABC transporter substrate-binding protein [Streptomyces marispadix]|uniref:Sugar ABC transporter substrate-binding protein n=1 Tax=Streptomyces marispadix TaxID=2922868 RepID=A0ABS9SZA0_9ACTN|nr:sugar ABC transporter substrate-binding protein [Streptomyces marispadix]MCH6161621.1 sugar ABC transporter substrate-binding protein [Streptomyces marispadix]